MANSLLQRLHEGQRELHNDLQRYKRHTTLIASPTTATQSNNAGQFEFTVNHNT